MKILPLAATIGRAALYTLRGCWSFVVVLSAFVTLDSGLPGVVNDVKHSGVLKIAGTVWLTLVTFLTQHAIDLLALVVSLGVLTYYLVDRAKARSALEFEAERKRPPAKPRSKSRKS